MGFVKYTHPCHSCGGSDPVSVNDDGSAYCFSCNTFFKDYSTSEVHTPKEDNTINFNKHQFENNEGFVKRSFNALTDRGISLETAKKYGTIKVLLGLLHQKVLVSSESNCFNQEANTLRLWRVSAMQWPPMNC